MNHKVLLIEDDPLSAEFMKIFLEGEGHEVTIANSCQEALRLFKTFQPSIIITDIQLGDGSGIELAKKFKEEGIKKVIGVSGFSKTQLAQMNRDTSNLDQVLVKPVELTELAAVIQKM